MVALNSKTTPITNELTNPYPDGTYGAFLINDFSDDHTLTIEDADQYIEMNSPDANTVTVPPNSDVSFVEGTAILIFQAGAGETSIGEGEGVTIKTPSTLNLRTENSTACLVYRGNNIWHLSGDLEP